MLGVRSPRIGSSFLAADLCCSQPRDDLRLAFLACLWLAGWPGDQICQSDCKASWLNRLAAVDCPALVKQGGTACGLKIRTGHRVHSLICHLTHVWTACCFRQYRRAGWLFRFVAAQIFLHQGGCAALSPEEGSGFLTEPINGRAGTLRLHDSFRAKKLIGL